MSVFLPEQEEAALGARFESVCRRLEKAAAASGRDMGDVRLVAISKTHPASALAALAAMWKNGTPTFGENYVQEAVEKQTAVASLLVKSANAAPTPEWHFTGHVQSRKAKEVVGRFSLIHTLDSEKLAGQIQKTVRETALPPQAVLIQVNIGDESQKSGVSAAVAEKLITTVMPLPEIAIQGLMCLPPICDDAEASRTHFVKLRLLRDDLVSRTGLRLPHLSMGMSHDCEVAIAEGATMVRIGSDIFGSRPAKV